MLHESVFAPFCPTNGIDFQPKSSLRLSTVSSLSKVLIICADKQRLPLA